MNQLILISVLVTLTTILSSCAESSGACEEELTQDQVQRIVDAETMRRLGSVPRVSERQITIDREGCDYIYFEQRIPLVPGAHLEVRIDEHGRVIDYIPGH